MPVRNPGQGQKSGQGRSRQSGDDGGDSGYIKGRYYYVNGKVMLWNGSSFVDPFAKTTDTTSNSSGSSSGFGGGAGAAVTTITGRKLSQAAVDALKADFRHIFNLYNIPVSGGALSHLVKMDLSTSEVLDRVRAINKLNTNQVFLQQFSRTLVQQGLAPKVWNRQQMREFVLGTAPGKFYAAYAKATERTGLVNAGLQIGKPSMGGDLTVGHRFVQHLMGALGRDAVLGNTASVNEVYAKIANSLMNDLPEARYQDFQLGKRDLIDLYAGGEHSAELARRLQQIRVNAAARAQGPAQMVQPNPQQDTGYTAGSA